MIKSCVDAETEKIYQGQISRKLPATIQKTARHKLLYLDDAEDFRDLLALSGNRLEKLHSERASQYSIRINDQWRIFFYWKASQAQEVEIVDYQQ